MKITLSLSSTLAILAIVAWGSGAAAIEPADRCVAQKIHMTGKYLACRMTAEAKGVFKGLPAEFSKCEEKFADKWARIELKADGACPTNGDAGGVQALATADTGLLAGTVAAAARFTANGNGTTTDLSTGLTWEDKSLYDDSVHDLSTEYTTATAVSVHIATLNATAFAGHSDWRLPSLSELMSLVNFGATGDVLGYPAFDVSCDPMGYWSCSLPNCNCAFTDNADGYLSSVVDPYESDRVLTIQIRDGLPIIDSDDRGQVIAVRGQPRLPY